MRSLKHGNLIALTEVFETKNSLYMVMELLEGGNLLEILNKNGPFKEKHAVAVLYQLLEGVKSMHAKRIMHRDIKPENIIMKKYY